MQQNNACLFSKCGLLVAFSHLVDQAAPACFSVISSHFVDQAAPACGAMHVVMVKVWVSSGSASSGT